MKNPAGVAGHGRSRPWYDAGMRQLVQRYPNAFVFASGIYLIAFAFSAEKWIVSLQDRTLLPASRFDILRELSRPVPWEYLLGGTFSLGVGVALAGVYFACRKAFIRRKQTAAS